MGTTSRLCSKVVLLSLLMLASDGVTPAQDARSWIGTRVVQKRSDFTLKIGNQVIDTKKIDIYRVERVNGSWLWLHAPGISGWAKMSDVVPYDQAIDYFTGVIQGNPRDGYAYTMRAIIWRDKNELDIALGDYNEAIRLDPTHAWVFNNRGLVLHDKNEYDRAIADYNEAIRLDPKYDSAYYNRGRSWQAKKDYDRAIADYNEAIRLDPKYAMAYNSRGNAWQAKKDYDRAIADYNEAIRIDPKYARPYFGRAATLLIAARPGAGAEARALLDRFGWRDDSSIYAVLVGYFGDRRDHRDDEARRILDDAAGKLDKEAWPYPVVRCLRGDIDATALLAAASDNDKQTEAHAYLGLDRLFSGERSQAIEHLRWVKEHGNPDFVEYTLAVAELDRLEAEPAATGR
jgi:tetratricopeptide (TPR) repeat protein